jgi:ParB family chromosome partitioning protein
VSKRGLGRGLGALIPDTRAFSEEEGDRIRSVPVSAIVPNPSQPRKEFADEDISSLAASIRERGLLQPILVRRTEGEKFELVAGERRWRAVQLAGFDQIPAIVRDTPDEEMLPLALIENLLREDLDPIEQARAFRELARSGLTQAEIASRVGRGRALVANTIRLLNLPPEIQEQVASGRLSPGHARALLSCDTETEMLALRDRILAQELTVREVEAEAVPVEGPPRKRARSKKRLPRAVSPETRDLEERLQRVFGTPVQIQERAGRGRLSLEFYSYDDLDRLTDLLFAAEARAAMPSRREAPAR